VRRCDVLQIECEGEYSGEMWQLRLLKSNSGWYEAGATVLLYTERQTAHNRKENNRKGRRCCPCIAIPFPLLLSLVSALRHHLGKKPRVGWEATIE
jgi:hypothetical protein